MGDRLAPTRNHDITKSLEALTGFMNHDTLFDLSVRFSETYSDLAKNSLDQFLVTPVTALPTGKEKGKFICIDVGGSNLRVGFIELVGEVDGGTKDRNNIHCHHKVIQSHDKNWPIEEHLKMDKAEDLFAWIGDCIAEVITDALSHSSSLVADELLLGITFSFPMA
jgi:hexokinase